MWEVFGPFYYKRRKLSADLEQFAFHKRQFMPLDPGSQITAVE